MAVPTGILANLIRVMELIEEFGPDLGRPLTAPLGQGLFEIRAKGQEGIARSIFCILKGQEIVILLTVIKKSHTIPKRQMAMVKKRLKEVLSHEH